MTDTSLNRNYAWIAAAVIRQAADDYFKAVQKGNESEQREIEKFFRSGQCERFANVDGDYVLNELQKVLRVEQSR